MADEREIERLQAEIESLRAAVASLRALPVWLVSRMKQFAVRFQRPVDDFERLVCDLEVHVAACKTTPSGPTKPRRPYRPPTRDPRPAVPLRRVTMAPSARGLFAVDVDGIRFTLSDSLGHLLAILAAADTGGHPTPDGAVSYKSGKWVKSELEQRTGKRRKRGAFNQLLNRLRRELEAQGFRGYVESGRTGYRLFTRQFGWTASV